MITLAAVAQAVAVVSACWAIILGIGAWKREFIGKRQIELAELTLAKFFEIKDAIALIRNPFAATGEGETRQRSENESPNDSQLLDRAYIVVERYAKKGLQARQKTVDLIECNLSKKSNIQPRSTPPTCRYASEAKKTSRLRNRMR